jgi:uncharacterized membrane protein
MLLGTSFAMADTWTTLDYPGGSRTQAFGISGNSIVGTYQDSSSNLNSFLYNGTTWTTLGYPGGFRTEVSGISGNSIVGTYQDSSGYLHSFLYTIPEPATLLLFALGGLALRRNR